MLQCFMLVPLVSVLEEVVEQVAVGICANIRSEILENVLPRVKCQAASIMGDFGST
jgi:hypothetical protein